MSHNARVSLREANRRIVQLDIELGRTRKQLAEARALLKEACEHRVENTGTTVVRCSWFDEAKEAGGE